MNKLKLAALAMLGFCLGVPAYSLAADNSIK